MYDSIQEKLNAFDGRDAGRDERVSDITDIPLVKKIRYNRTITNLKFITLVTTAAHPLYSCNTTFEVAEVEQYHNLYM